VAPRRLALVLLGIAVPAAVFAFAAISVVGNRTPRWDSRLLRWAYAHDETGGWWRLANGWGSPAATEIALAVMVALCLVLLAWRRVGRAVFVVAAVGGALALETALKHAFARDALYEGSSSYSFPSGHAMVAASLATAAALALPTLALRVAAGVAGSLWAFETGVAAVFQHDHYPSDVLGGWALAVAWTSALWFVARRFLR
jgi:membrane-associated phospholipid phosphatase